MSLSKKALSLILSITLVFTCIFTVNLKQSAEAATTNVLLLKGTASGSKNVKLSWNKISGTTEYVLSISKAGTGVKTSHKIAKNKTSYTAKKWNKKAFQKGYCYSFLLKAYKGNTCKATSKKIYVIVNNISNKKLTTKYSNATKIKASAENVNLRIGQAKTITAKLTQYKNKKQNNSWGAITYKSSNTSIAKVNSKGKITGVKSGTAKFYSIAPNGIYTTTTVKVKYKMSYALHYNTNRGWFTSDIYTGTITYGKSYGSLPEVYRDGYNFGGWYTANGTKITQDTVYRGHNDVTLYAHWVSQTVEISLNSNGGTLPSGTKKTITLTTGNPIGQLPIPTKDGYSFDGWYTSDGVKVDDDTVINDNITIIARWSPSEPPNLKLLDTITLNAMADTGLPSQYKVIGVGDTNGNKQTVELLALNNLEILSDDGIATKLFQWHKDDTRTSKFKKYDSTLSESEWQNYTENAGNTTVNAFQNYDGSDIDNTLYQAYKLMPASIKNNIIPQNITQCLSYYGYKSGTYYGYIKAYNRINNKKYVYLPDTNIIRRFGDQNTTAKNLFGGSDDVWLSSVGNDRALSNKEVHSLNTWKGNVSSVIPTNYKSVRIVFTIALDTDMFGYEAI